MEAATSGLPASSSRARLRTASPVIGYRITRRGESVIGSVIATDNPSRASVQLEPEGRFNAGRHGIGVLASRRA